MNERIEELMSIICEGENSIQREEVENYINNLQSKIDKAIEYIEKYLEEHIIEDQPDEQSIFYDEKGYYISNAKEQLLDILKGSVVN